MSSSVQKIQEALRRKTGVHRESGSTHIGKTDVWLGLDFSFLLGRAVICPVSSKRQVCVQLRGVGQLDQ